MSAATAMLLTHFHGEPKSTLVWQRTPARHGGAGARYAEFADASAVADASPHYMVECQFQNLPKGAR